LIYLFSLGGDIEDLMAKGNNGGLLRGFGGLDSLFWDTYFIYLDLYLTLIVPYNLFTFLLYPSSYYPPSRLFFIKSPRFYLFGLL
jgi:hypothetical protein